jgi:hypothetical protein
MADIPVFPEPPSAFRPDYLTRLQEAEEPVTAAEAELSGPWKVEHHARGWALYRTWEDPVRHRPQAVFRHRWRAELLAATLPLLARGPYLESGEEGEEGGVPLREAGLGQGGGTQAAIGWLEPSSGEILALLEAAEILLRSGPGLALLLLAAGPLVIRQVGEVLAAEDAGTERHPRDS